MELGERLRQCVVNYHVPYFVSIWVASQMLLEWKKNTFKNISFQGILLPLTSLFIYRLTPKSRASMISGCFALQKQTSKTISYRSLLFNKTCPVWSPWSSFFKILSSGKTYTVLGPYRWLSARLQYLQCVSSGDIAVLYEAIDIIIQVAIIFQIRLECYLVCPAW